MESIWLLIQAGWSKPFDQIMRSSISLHVKLLHLGLISWYWTTARVPRIHWPLPSLKKTKPQAQVSKDVEDLGGVPPVTEAHDRGGQVPPVLAFHCRTLGGAAGLASCLGAWFQAQRCSPANP